MLIRKKALKIQYQAFKVLKDQCCTAQILLEQMLERANVVNDKSCKRKMLYMTNAV